MITISLNTANLWQHYPKITTHNERVKEKWSDKTTYAKKLMGSVVFLLADTKCDFFLCSAWVCMCHSFIKFAYCSTVFVSSTQFRSLPAFYSDYNRCMQTVDLNNIYLYYSPSFWVPIYSTDKVYRNLGVYLFFKKKKSFLNSQMMTLNGFKGLFLGKWWTL